MFFAEWQSWPAESTPVYTHRSQILETRMKDVKISSRCIFIFLLQVFQCIYTHACTYWMLFQGPHDKVPSTDHKVYHCVVRTGRWVTFQGPWDEVPVTDHNQSLSLCCSDRMPDVVSRTVGWSTSHRPQSKFITVLFWQDTGCRFKDHIIKYQSQTTIKVYLCVVLTGCWVSFQEPCDEVPVPERHQSLSLCSDRMLGVVLRTVWWSSSPRVPSKFITVLFWQDAGCRFKDRVIKFQSQSAIKSMGLHSAWDLEDLVELMKKKKVPFFFSFYFLPIGCCPAC